MEISVKQTKLMKNSANDIQSKTKLKGQKPGTISSFKHLGAAVSNDGSKTELSQRLHKKLHLLTKLSPIWRDNKVYLESKVKLMHSLVISIYVCLLIVDLDCREREKNACISN